MASSSAWRFVPEPETSTTRRPGRRAGGEPRRGSFSELACVCTVVRMPRAPRIRGTLRSGRPSATIPAHRAAPTGRGRGRKVASGAGGLGNAVVVWCVLQASAHASQPFHLGEDAHLMPDRPLRLLTLPPQSSQGGERIGVLLRERPAAPADAAGTPSGGSAGDHGRGGSSRGTGGGQGDGATQGASGGQGDGEDRDASQDTRDDNPFAPPPEGTPDRPGSRVARRAGRGPTVRRGPRADRAVRAPRPVTAPPGATSGATGSPAVPPVASVSDWAAARGPAPTARAARARARA